MTKKPTFPAPRDWDAVDREVKNLISPASLKKLRKASAKIRKLYLKLDPNPWDDDTPQKILRWVKLANKIRLAEMTKVEKKS